VLRGLPVVRTGGMAAGTTAVTLAVVGELIELVIGVLVVELGGSVTSVLLGVGGALGT
jgi:hypothetical protein